MLQNPFSLENHFALVTGGGTGLGLAISTALIQAGARVLITGRREEPLKAACAQLGERACYMQHDVTDLESIPDLVTTVESTYGPVTTLVNNAGNHLKKPLLETSNSDFDLLLQTHLYGSFVLSREFGRRMVERQEGSITMILSMATFMSIPLVASYTVAKTGLLGLVRALVAEFSPYNVRINAVAPGWFDTDITHKALNNDPERKAKAIGRIPMNRFGDPQDVGNSVVFLSSPAASYLTGIVLPVDGGASVSY